MLFANRLTFPNMHRRRFRRLLVRVRISPFTIPLLLLVIWSVIVLGLVLSADPWIAVLAITPLMFAISIALLCLIAYRIDFYA